MSDTMEIESPTPINLKKSRLPSKRALIYVAAFAVIGLAALAFSFADSATSSVVLNGNKLSWNHAGVVVKTDTLAHMNWNTTGVATVNLSVKMNKLVMAASGTQCDNAPFVTINVDGKA